MLCYNYISQEGIIKGKNPFSEKTLKFSVCTPVYKDAYKTLDKFFTALAEQDYKNFEVLITFDGPNKRGVSLLEEQKKKFPELDVKYWVIPHGGAPKARNHSASHATGDILTFLDPDIFLYPETLREWANAFENNPDKDVVWGLYEVSSDGQTTAVVGGSVPVDANGKPDYYAFRSSNYCSGANPIRKESFIGWDESVKSLQDWDMWMRMLIKDDFKGEKFLYIPKPFFITLPPQEGGISHDSASNWLDRVDYIRGKNGVLPSSICVCSLGAPMHGIHVAKKLGADYLPMPSFKPNRYKIIYLLGFYPEAAKEHMQVFEGFKGKKLIHWIGSDILGMHWHCSFQKIKALKKWFEREKIVMFTEAEHTHKEMEELGINTKIVPIPPQKLYDPMPLPEEFTVGIYENQTQKVYSEELMEDVARAMPDVKFIFFGDSSKKGLKYGNVEHVGYVDMDELMPKVSCNLRVTMHDGLPITPLQFLTAGRNVVSNTEIPGATKVEKDRKKIIEALRLAQDNPLPPEWSDHWKKVLDFSKFQRTIWRYL